MNDGVRIDQRLPKAEILRKTSDFNEVFEKGRPWNGKFVKCLFVKSNRRLVGFVVSKRFGNAVKRNRLKRLMREVYRRNRYRIGSYKMVLMPRPHQGRLLLANLEGEFQKLCACLKPE
jgi:ribonuclease P protein component